MSPNFVFSFSISHVMYSPFWTCFVLILSITVCPPLNSKFLDVIVLSYNPTPSTVPGTVDVYYILLEWVNEWMMPFYIWLLYIFLYIFSLYSEASRLFCPYGSAAHVPCCAACEPRSLAFAVVGWQVCAPAEDWIIKPTGYEFFPPAEESASQKAYSDKKSHR